VLAHDNPELQLATAPSVSTASPTLHSRTAQRTAVKLRPHQETTSCPVAMTKPVLLARAKGKTVQVTTTCGRQLQQLVGRRSRQAPQTSGSACRSQLPPTCLRAESRAHTNDLPAFRCERLAREKSPAVVVGIVNDQEDRCAIFQDRGVRYSCHVSGLIEGPVFHRSPEALVLTRPHDVAEWTTCVETKVHSNANDDSNRAGNE
jgi:hypothetical protein